MILTILFAFFFALFALRRNARWKIATTIAAVVLFWLISAGWLAVPVLDCAQPQAYRKTYDARNATRATFGSRADIVVLGAGTREHDGQLAPKPDALARLATAAALYARCKATGATCRVLVSGGNPQRHAASEADNYAPYLLRARVAPADLILENRSLNTWENARNVARILRARPDERDKRNDTLLLVTSAYHMRRALLDFGYFGYAPIPVVSNARHAHTGWLPRLDNLYATETALHELIGTAQFYVYRKAGWWD